MISRHGAPVGLTLWCRHVGHTPRSLATRRHHTYRTSHHSRTRPLDRARPPLRLTPPPDRRRSSPRPGAFAHARRGAPSSLHASASGSCRTAYV